MNQIQKIEELEKLFGPYKRPFSYDEESQAIVDADRKHVLHHSAMGVLLVDMLNGVVLCKGEKPVSKCNWCGDVGFYPFRLDSGVIETRRCGCNKVEPESKESQEELWNEAGQVFAEPLDLTYGSSGAGFIITKSNIIKKLTDRFVITRKPQ